MNPSAILHIGTHKTGTTFLQRLLRENRGILEAQAVHLPVAGRGEDGAHYNNLGWELKESWRFDKILGGWDALETEISKIPREKSFIVSAESIGMIEGKESVDRIAGACERLGRRLHVIAYIRDQPDYINSLYVQSVKRLYTGRSFKHSLAGALESVRYNYDELFSVWRQHPAVTFHARPFRKGQVLHQDFLETIDRCTGGNLKDSQFIIPDPQNESFGPEAIRCARYFYAATKYLRLKKANQLLAAKFLIKTMRSEFNETEKFCGFNEASAAQVREHFRESNDNFSKAQWGCSWDEVFTPSTFQKNELDLKNINEDETKYLGQLVEKILLHKRLKKIIAGRKI